MGTIIDYIPHTNKSNDLTRRDMMHTVQAAHSSLHWHYYINNLIKLSLHPAIDTCYASLDYIHITVRGATSATKINKAKHDYFIYLH